MIQSMIEEGQTGIEWVEKLYGQTRAEKEFLESVQSENIHHAWLLSGKKGVGKASFAYRAAAFLLQGERNFDSENVKLDEQSRALPLVKGLSHPDLLVLRRPWDEKSKKYKEMITVEESRRVSAFFEHHAGFGGWRICIIDALDEMNETAANALLKTLEEPPEKCIFFLICHSVGNILPTIISRCRKLAFQPLTEADISEILRIKDANGLFSEDERMACSFLGEGSAGRAVDLLENNGLELYKQMVTLLMTLPDLPAEQLHELCDRVSQDKNSLASFISLYSDWLHRLIRYAATDISPTPLFEGEEKLYLRLKDTLPLERLVELWESLQKEYSQTLELNLDSRQFLLECFFSLASQWRKR